MLLFKSFTTLFFFLNNKTLANREIQTGTEFCGKWGEGRLEGGIGTDLALYQEDGPGSKEMEDFHSGHMPPQY